MGIFVLGGTMALYRAFKAEVRHLYWTVWAGVLIICAFLVKGLPGLFVIAAPLALALSEGHSYKKAIVQTFTLVGTLFLAGVILYLYEPARESLDIYLFERTANRLSDGATTENRYFILRILAENLAIPGILTLIAGLIFTRVNNERMQWEPLISFLTIMGIAGSLPFIATFVQRGFYLVPIYPFFALAFASILRPVIEKTTSQWRRRPVLQVSGWVLIVIGIGLTLYMGQFPDRDEEIISDVKVIKSEFQERSIFYTTAELNQNWRLKAYLERYARIAMNDRIEPSEVEFAILPKGAQFEEGEILENLSDKLKSVDVYSIAVQ